jgi:hypothetical protein
VLNHHPSLNSPAEVIWGAPAIARTINRSVAATYHMLERGHVPGAKRVGGRWCLMPSAFFAAIAA